MVSSEEQLKAGLFDAWSERDGTDATYLKLAEVLLRCQHRDLVEFLCELVRIQTSTPKQTMKSQLISNETTKVRILDVHGLDCDQNPQAASANVTTKGLDIMREVLRIQAVMRMNFKRILYFIPERGPLERCYEWSWR